MTDIIYRHMVDRDIPYIKATLLRSFRKGPTTPHVPNGYYFGFYSPLFDSLIKSANVLLAVNKDDPDHIYSWLIWENVGPALVVHYIFTKIAFRNLGIGKALISAAGIKTDNAFFYTLYSSDAKTLRRKYKHAVHNPFLLKEAKGSK